MGYFVCYNEIMKKFKSSSKNNSSKVKYTIRKDNVIMEDKHIIKIKGEDYKINVKFISDPKEPFYKHTIKEVK